MKFIFLDGVNASLTDIYNLILFWIILWIGLHFCKAVLSLLKRWWNRSC